MSMTDTDAPAWPDALYDTLRGLDVRIFCYVPDAGHKVLIDRSLADSDAISVPLTTEEEGVSLLAGAHLGGARGALLVQSSGIGNCINMLSLIQHGRFPLLTLVSMRGEFGEQNPWQVPMGRATQPVLEAMDTHCFKVEGPDQVVPTATAAVNMAYKSDRSVAVLLSQRLIGAKAF